MNSTMVVKSLSRAAYSPIDPAGFPRDDVVHERFEARADARPEAIAAVCGGKTITYGELETRANRIARRLRSRGVARGARVGMLLPRSTDAYAAMLGILKAGAAYVPLDPDYPADRVRHILSDSGARALVTRSDLEGAAAGVPLDVVRVDADRRELEGAGDGRPTREEIGVGSRDLAYVIYTSGSTGFPKGVMVEHRSVRHLVSTEQDLFEMRPGDRVFQGASLAFDLSVEEIWLALSAGATLVTAGPGEMATGEDLARFLTHHAVTVLSCVPTFLSMIESQIPTLRLVILGGEICPESLVRRWARPGLRMVNTYGPTEATVIATSAELRPGIPVTIGRAIPGYAVHLLDEALRPVPAGEAGEICISGVGVARGYVGRDAETAARFVAGGADPADRPSGRFYRSGDLGRIDAEGNLRYIGRADAQVKLRGFRVELSEIESVLQEAGALAAACSVHRDARGAQQLVAHVVPRRGAALDLAQLRAEACRRLPGWMVPAIVEEVEDLPRMRSGKLDRAALPAPRGRAAAPPPALPRNDAERRIARIWESLFDRHDVPANADFFLDLGGHSLLAARMVSKLREEPGFATLSVIDLYEHPTIAGLAAKADGTARGIRSDGACASPAAGAPGERGRHLRAGCVQGASLYLVFAVRALEWIAPYLTLFALLEGGRPLPIAAAWAAAAAVLSFPVLLAAAIAVKWTVLGRARAGRYPLWGAYYLRFWLVRNTIAGLHLSRLSGTPLLPWALRLLGARVGSDVHLDSDEIAAFDLVEIGDGACVDEGASLVGAEVESGVLILGTVRVGRGCFVGARSVLRPGTVMEDGARLDDLSLLPAGGRVPRGETWAGSPAGRSAPPSPRVAPPRRARWHLPLATLLYAALVLVIPTLPLLAFAPGIVFLARFDPLERPLPYLAAALPVGASFVLLLTSGVVLAKWCLVGRVRPGRYAVHGSLYVRKWIVDRLMDLSLDVAGSLHATLYLAPWYRALGARLGRNVELSTATSSTPDLLEIEDGGTVADEVSLGAPHVEGGWMTLAPTVLRRRAFVGNGAIVRAGSVLGAESLVGVLSISPGDLPEALRPGAAWLGSPARRLPRRQESAPFPEGRTFSPGRRLRLARGGAEIFRVTLPPSGFIFVTTATVEATLAAWHRLGAPGAILLAPLFFATCGLLLALGVAVAKWALLGRLRPFEHPLWSPFVWRLELVTALYEFMLTPILLEALHGTPMLPWYFRLLGARIGRRTYFHTTGLIEFDLVEVGDRAAIGDEAVLQTHLFEDRVLKGSSLRIGAGCCVGAGSVVLYDAEMAEGSTLGPLSLLMKGETLPAGTAWAGLPPRSLAGPREPGPVLARESTEEPFTAPRAPGGRRTGPASPSHGSRAFS